MHREEVSNCMTVRRMTQMSRKLVASGAMIGRRVPWIGRLDILTSLAQADWKNIEYFDESWRLRVEQMARFIPAGASVMDLGCGERWLRQIVGSERYTGVDYRSRSLDTIVCDFDQDEFPDIFRHVAFVSGCLEYIRDYPRFIAEVCRRTSLCILSYCPIETHGDLVGRRRAGWRNDLTIDAIEQEFGRHGFAKTDEELTASGNAVLVFRCAARDA
ncbi:MAG TPA: class I SAM-dependent methyltransferase [Acetobacteraceae bacterium]|nr:class I SAM-dependent methyltransferase [Acetobacteraceae bacterium]